MRLRTLWALVIVLAAAPAQAAPALSAGPFHTAAVGPDGKVRTWGEDLLGELGLGRLLFSLRPVPVNAAPPSSAIAAGFAHSVAVARDGTVWAWGLVGSGQLGDGSSGTSLTGRSVPKPMSGISGVKAAAAGSDHTLLLKTDGTVWATGLNGQGQLGDGSLTARLQPVPVSSLSGVTQIAAAGNVSAAVKADGTVWTWGQVGLNSGPSSIPVARSTPAQVPGLSGVVSVALAFTAPGISGFVDPAFVAAKSDGTVWLWTVVRQPVPQQVAGLSQITQVAAGTSHALALKSDGTVLAWGTNSSGQLGNGTQVDSAVPVAVTGLSGVVAISASANTSAARKGDGTVMMWGDNASGHLGDGTRFVSRLAPVAVTGLSGAAAVAVGESFTLALMADGSIEAWGDNESGQLGDGAPTIRQTPAIVPSLDNVIAVSAGPTYTLGLKSDGTVWVWGDNSLLFTPQEHASPVQIAGLSRIVAISAGPPVAALRDDGTVWAFGLGAPSLQVQAPAQIAGLSGVTAVASAGGHLFALKSDGTIAAMGNNFGGVLGDGTTTDRSSPVPVLAVSNATAISASQYYGMALTRDGKVWTWGQNTHGMLGDGTTASRSVPAAIAGLPPVAAIAAGDLHALALTASGQAWTWGDNSRGQLGLGDFLGRPTPQAVAFPTGVTDLAGGAFHTVARTADGLLWSWGDNSLASLGDGTLTIRTTAVVVRHEDGTGAIAANDWYLDFAPGRGKVIPPDKVPPFLAIVSGDVSAPKVQVTAVVNFRATDLGKPIRIFAYAPAAIVKRAAEPKDTAACVLAQLGADGSLHQLAPSGLAPYVSGVTSSQGQSVTLLDQVASAQVAGATICLGTGANGSDAVDGQNSHCMATVPANTICPPPGTAATIAANVPGKLSGLWWNAAESGWGIDFTQRGSVIFAAWYTYDSAGNPKRYVASDCSMAVAGATSGTCNGALYEVAGPPFFGVPFNASAVKPAPVGTLQVDFQDPANASMTYTAAGVTRTVPIVRQVFQTGSTPPAVDYTDLWWNPRESGWGIAITQQYGVMFLAWFVYDASGKPAWYVATNCAVAGNGCSGALYRVTGPPFGPAFDATRVVATPVGNATVSFSDPNNGTLTYTVNGVAGTKTITRQVF